MKSDLFRKFDFEFRGYGKYNVTYTTGRGDYYKSLITDMTLIDATKNAVNLTIKNIIRLKNAVKRVGIHYHKNDKPF